MKRKSILYSILFVTIVFVSSVAPGIAVADADCLLISNGGLTTQQFCPTPTPLSVQTQNNNTQQNGRQTVFPSTKTKSTPNTGPETWMLFALFGAGTLGMMLRNKL